MSAGAMRKWVAGQQALPEVMVRGVKAMDVDLDGIRVGVEVTLRAEPTNPHDRNAIQVLACHGKPAADGLRVLGYIPRNYAEVIEADEWLATVCTVLEFEGRPSGLRLRLVRRADND